MPLADRHPVEVGPTPSLPIMNSLLREFWRCILLTLGLASAHAVTLPHVFGDHMVLQSGMPVPVWGWAEPGEQITVRLGDQLSRTTVTGRDGQWKVAIGPLPISAQPEKLTIAGRETITYHDVLVGEVWLCSGQSNMQKPVGWWRGQPIQTVNSVQELAAADYPLIRLLNLKIAETAAPARDIDVTQRPKQDYPWAGWVPCSPASLDTVKFSAVGYFFGRKLYRELKIPIGLIEATAGGTHIEAWTPPAGFAADPMLADFVHAAETPKVSFQGTRISTLYYGMIHPLEPFGLRGVLWYQGESNVYNQDGAIYAHKMAALINSWRADWGRDFSFYFVQLPPLLYSVSRSQYVHSPEVEPIFREAQAAAMELPQTGMVVTTDVGDPNNMHPPRKKEVGERLALWALARDYGHTDIECSGPIYRNGSAEFNGDRVILHFSHVGRGLVSADGQPLNWFTVAGADGKYFPAAASIVGDTVLLTSPQVTEPKQARFAWSEGASPNFFNRDGLPAVPFRTDNPFATQAPKGALPGAFINNQQAE
jgi:sialate O-acetylesterase